VLRCAGINLSARARENYSEVENEPEAENESEAENEPEADL